MLSSKTVQWVLRSSNPIRTAYFLLPVTSKNFEQKRSVSWFLGQEEHRNYLSQASYFYSNPEYAQWKEKPFRNGNSHCFILFEILFYFLNRINGGNTT
jgi:hypothetical protein